MTSSQQELSQILESCAAQLRELRVSGTLVRRFEELAGQVDEPCVLAVVGRVKAGKSSFLNALLGDDLAMVGITETTATINRFVWGDPDPRTPVRCYWRSGGWTDVSREFLDSLQGNSEEVLRRADSIDYLEYRLPLSWLRHVTLVDTPGLESAVDEHTSRTAEYLELRQRLRERQDSTTRSLTAEADAVIYLVGASALASDRDVLKSFSELTSGSQARALKALGVLAQVDRSEQLLEHRYRLAAGVAQDLQDCLKLVVPVSAALQRAADRFTAEPERLEKILTLMRRLPASRREFLLDNAGVFLEEPYPDCPPPEERAELIRDLPWTTFVTLVRTAASCDWEAEPLREQLRALGGFGPLGEILDRQFFQQGRTLRAFRIVRDARLLLARIRDEEVPAMERHAQEVEAQTARWIQFLRDAPGDPGTRAELEDFVRLHRSLERSPEGLNQALEVLDRALEPLELSLRSVSDDLDALQETYEYSEQFSDAELAELRPLLGQYGANLASRLGPDQRSSAYLIQRQRAWQRLRDSARGPARRRVAQRAFLRYGYLRMELDASSHSPKA